MYQSPHYWAIFIGLSETMQCRHLTDLQIKIVAVLTFHPGAQGGGSRVESRTVSVSDAVCRASLRAEVSW